MLSELFLVATSQRQVIYAAKIKASDQPSAFGKINTAALSSGIVQLTVFNKDMQPLSERVVFVNNNEFLVPGKLEVVEKNLGKRGLNTLDIQLPDTLKEHLSISVTDAELASASGNNIVTDFLLKNDIRGFVYQPQQYFFNTTPVTASNLDLVMKTNGWRRYNWENILASPLLGDPEPAKEEYINFSGTISDLKGNPIPNGFISLIMRTKDSASQVSLVAADEKGQFRQTGMIYSDSATLYYYITKNKEDKQKVQIRPGNSLSFPSNAMENYPSYSFLSPFLSPAVRTVKMRAYIPPRAFIDTFEQKGKTLQEVVLKSKVKDSLLLMDDKHAVLYKGHKGGRIYDIMHDPNASDARDVINYLFVWTLPSRFLYPNFMIYLDELPVPPVESSRLKRLKLSQIAYVKYVPEDFSEPFTSGIYIYTKNEEDYQHEDEKRFNTKLFRVKIAGYSPVKEFYHPDYSIANNLPADFKDVQTTVHWQPDLIKGSQSKTLRVSFYNNEISDKLKVVLEGINEAGQIIYAEKLLE